MSWPVLSTHKKIQLKKLYCCLHTISLWVFAKSYFICANFFSRKDIFFSPVHAQKKERKLFKTCSVSGDSGSINFFFFSTFVSICFLVLLLKWRQQSMVWCPWCSSKEKGWRSMQWDGPASVEAVRFLGPIRMPLRLFCLLACKILILCLKGDQEPCDWSIGNPKCIWKFLGWETEVWQEWR